MKLETLTRWPTLIAISILMSFSSSHANDVTAIKIFTAMDPTAQGNHPLYFHGISIVKQSELDYHVHPMPWNRAYHSALQTRNSILFPIYKTPDRANKFKWICPITASRSVYLFRLTTRDDLHVSHFTNIKNKTIGVVKDNVVHHYLASHNQNDNLNFDTTVYDSTNISKLLSGRVDYIAQSEQQMYEYLLRHNKPISLVKKEVLIYSHNKFPLCMAISRNSDKAIVRRLHTAYQALYGHHQFLPEKIPVTFAQCH